MKSEEFEAGVWIERLARALPGLSKTQGPFLKEYWQQNPRVNVVVDGRDETPFPLDDLRMLYAQAAHGFGEHAYYAPLRAGMDPVRTLLRSHPTLWGAVGPRIDNDDFWVQIHGHGSLTSLTDLIGGLMARADELPGDGFHEAAGELHALLHSASGGNSSAEPGGLDIGYDVVLFHGLCLEEEIDIGGGLTMLPFERARAFVDEEVLKDMAPDVVRFRDWRLVGAVVRPFQWRPVFRRRGDLTETDAEPPGPFGPDALEFLELLAVSHRVPIVCLAVVRECLSRSACRLLGQAHNHGGVQWGRPVHRFHPFAKPPGPRSEVVAEAKTAYGERKSQRYGKLAPVVARLAEALARDGRFSAEDKILDVAIALDRHSGAGTIGSSSWTANSERSRPKTWNAGSMRRRRRSSGGDMNVRRNDEYLREAVAAAARARDAMKPVFDLCQGLRQAMQPFADLQEQIVKIQAQIRKSHEQNLAVVREIQGHARFTSAVAKLDLGPLKAVAEQLANDVRRAQAFDTAGWLPHHSTPLDQVEKCAGDSDTIHALLSSYYKERWREVRQNIETRLTEYGLDEEAKETFGEALTAHEAGLYRSVCRLLFPEIERVARKELHCDKMERITSQHVLRKVAGCIPISAMEPGGFLGLNLFDRLSNHLYETAYDEDARQRLARDPVPNRHAVVHGLVVYSSMQNSLNAIFMTDYIFLVISLLKVLEDPPRKARKESGREPGEPGLRSEG